MDRTDRMDHRFILRETSDAVATLTLNRPDVLNSFNRAMVAELTREIRTLGDDDAVRAVVITGAGRAFCAGQDLAEAAPADATTLPDIGEIVEGYNGLILAMRGLEKPIVCAVNGVAAGAGANIALAGDFVIAGEHASFIQAFSKIGLVPDNGGTFFLPRLVGMARATRLAMLGEKLTAQHAYEWGLIYRVVPDGELAHIAVHFARELAVMPTRALGLIKRGLNAAWENDLASQLALEAKLQSEAGRTADYAEGVRAFQQKRPPRFTGR